METIWAISLIAVGVLSGLMLVIGIIFLSFYREKKARRQTRSERSREGTLSGVQFERTEGGAWPTSHGDGGADH